MAVWYLDNDDEITDAVARLRGASDAYVVFVVPPGSRIATGRINFKLLAREAETRDLGMAIASGDEQVRALAASAGVLVTASADEAEAALARGDEPPEVTEVASLDPAAHPTEATSTVLDAAAGGGDRLVWRNQRVRVTTAIVLALAVIGAFLAWQTLPTAEIILVPRLAALGPIEVPVVALPSANEPDAESGRIPAVELSIPLSAEGTFSASGAESVETLATGEVEFSSTAQAFDQEIVAGTRVHTPVGVEFQTTEAVTLPRSAGDGGPARVRAPVEALMPGEDGNVAAGSITVVPSLESQDISVTNPRATSGGRFDVTPVVTTQDYDAAAVDLQNRLVGALATYLRDPANVPEGLTLFAETARPGTVVLEPSADDVIGSIAPDFALVGRIVAGVLAVDTELVDSVARQRLLDGVPEGAAILAESVSVERGEGSADGQEIRFTGVASGQVYLLVDVEALRDQVAGLPVSDAQAILEEIGTATVSVWPDFLAELPRDRQRIMLDVLTPSTTE